MGFFAIESTLLIFVYDTHFTLKPPYEVNKMIKVIFPEMTPSNNNGNDNDPLWRAAKLRILAGPAERIFEWGPNVNA